MSGFVPDSKSQFVPDSKPAPSGGGFVPDAPKPRSLASYVPHINTQQMTEHLADWESNLYEHWHNAVNHPIGTILTATGGLARAEGAVAENVQSHASLHDSLNNINQLVWSPTPESVQKARASLQHGLHMSNDSDIDTAINGHLKKYLGGLAPYVSNTLKTINNVATDTLGDPFALAGDIGTAARDLGLAREAVPATHVLYHAAHAAAVNPVTKPLIHAGVHAARTITSHMYNLLNARGAGPAFSHLKQAVEATKNTAANTHRALQDVFTTRPDLLHAGLTPAGRDIRVQLENSQRILRHKELLKFKSADEDSIKALHAFHDKELARKTKEVFSEEGGKSLTKKGTSIDWDKYKAPSDEFLKKLKKKTKMASDLGRAGIELNPLPHGLVNVGTLSALGGGLSSVARGMAAMVRPENHEVSSRLIQMGAGTPEYIGNHGKGLLPGYKEATNAMSGVLGKMENGWRAGMLEHLDSILGPSSPGSKAEYLKGALINKKLGDYHTQSAFAQYFAAAGGPYVMYHLGILPKAVIDSVKQNPIAYETISRIRDQMQQNREGAGQNELSSSDPVSETAKAVEDPVGFAVSPSTLPLPVSAGIRLYNDWKSPSESHETADQGIMSLLETHIAPYGMYKEAEQNIEGKSFNGQSMSFADHLAAVIMGSLNMHIHSYPSYKTEHREEKYIEKHAGDYDSN